MLNVGAYGEMISSGITGDAWQNKKYMKVNLSVPKFDVSSTVNLKDGLGRMGVTKVFDMESSDFTAITSDLPVYVTAVNQSARVEIDEKGVKAATYIEIPGAGSAMPPEEIIDFVLDRPFVFVISNIVIESNCEEFLMRLKDNYLYYDTEKKKRFPKGNRCWK